MLIISMLHVSFQMYACVMYGLMSYRIVLVQCLGDLFVYFCRHCCFAMGDLCLFWWRLVMPMVEHDLCFRMADMHCKSIE